jgi:hypothetical protein
VISDVCLLLKTWHLEPNAGVEKLRNLICHASRLTM